MSNEWGPLHSLHAQAFSLIEKGKRPTGQVQALLKALQYFKENRLATAIPLLAEDQILRVEDLHQLLSLKLDESSLGKGTTVAHLNKRGFEYVGELYTANWKGSKGIAKTIREFLWSLSLPEELDLAQTGWLPPYVDKNFMWKMQQPLEIFINLEDAEHTVHSYLARYLQHNFHYLGEIFSRSGRSWHRYSHGLNLEGIQTLLNRSSNLRAGMYCPNWQMPPEPPK